MNLTDTTTPTDAMAMLKDIENHLVNLYKADKRIKALEIIKTHIATANAIGGEAGLLIKSRLKLLRSMIANQTLIIKKSEQ